MKSAGLRLGFGVGAALVATALVTYVAARLAGEPPIWFVDLFLWGGLVLAIAVTGLRGRKSDRLTAPSAPLPARTRGLALTLLPGAALLPGLVALLTSPRLQMSFHGYLHSAYTYQALEGTLPPENPLLAGTPGNDYWLFHVLLAGISHVLRVAPPVAGTLVNLLALAACLGAIVWILTTLELLRRRPLLRTCAALFVLFGANLAGIVHAGVSELTGGEPTDPVGISTMVLSGAARSAGLFPKFLNFNGFPLGIAFFLLALGGVVAVSQRVTVGALWCYALGAVGALAFHITTGLFAVATLSLAPVVASLVTRDRPPVDVRRAQVVVWAGLLLAGLAILAHYVMSVDDALGPGARIDVWHPENIRRFLGLVYPLLPLFVVGAVHGFRTRRRVIVALTWVAAAGSLAACTAVLPDDNQYKFDYLAGIAIALVALIGVHDLLSQGAVRARLATAASGVAIALVIVNVVFQGISYARSDLAAQDTVAYEGVNIVGEGPNADAWEWIAANTPEDAVVVVPVVGANRAPVLAMSRRSIFALDGGPFTAEKDEFTRRRAVAEQFYGGTVVPPLFPISTEIPNRPLILAIPAGYPDELPPDAALVYDERGVRLYDVTSD